MKLESLINKKDYTTEKSTQLFNMIASLDGTVKTESVTHIWNSAVTLVGEGFKLTSKYGLREKQGKLDLQSPDGEDIIGVSISEGGFAIYEGVTPEGEKVKGVIVGDLLQVHISTTLNEYSKLETKAYVISQGNTVVI